MHNINNKMSTYPNFYKCNYCTSSAYITMIYNELLQHMVHQHPFYELKYIQYTCTSATQYPPTYPITTVRRRKRGRPHKNVISPYGSYAISNLLNRDDSSLFECPYCEYTSTESYVLAKHILRHSIFKCKYCEFSTPITEELHKHTVYRHDELIDWNS